MRHVHGGVITRRTPRPMPSRQGQRGQYASAVEAHQGNTLPFLGGLAKVYEGLNQDLDSAGDRHRPNTVRSVTLGVNRSQDDPAPSTPRRRRARSLVLLYVDTLGNRSHSGFTAMEDLYASLGFPSPLSPDAQTILREELAAQNRAEEKALETSEVDFEVRFGVDHGVSL